MPADFSYFKDWIIAGHRPAILECIPSRSGLSLQVYDRGKRIMTVNGYGFDRIGTALGKFLETLFQKELLTWACSLDETKHAHVLPHGAFLSPVSGRVYLEGASSVESMSKVAEAIGLKVQLSESKAGTLILISKKG